MGSGLRFDWRQILGKKTVAARVGLDFGFGSSPLIHALNRVIEQFKRVLDPQEKDILQTCVIRETEHPCAFPSRSAVRNGVKDLTVLRQTRIKRSAFHCPFVFALELSTGA